MSKPINGAKPTEWAKHLRPWGKRAFWKRHRNVPIEDNDQFPLSPSVKQSHKVRKHFGIEYRYRSSTIPQWYFGKNPFDWKPYWSWYATSKARNQALERLQRPISKYGFLNDQEYRTCER